MSNKFNDVKAKNGTYYFFNDIINIENFDDNIEINEKSYKNVLFTMLDIWQQKDSEYVKIYSVNPLYFIFRYVNEYFEEINKNEYSTLVPTNKSKEQIKKYEELGIKLRYSIWSITKIFEDYDEKFWK